MVDQFIFKIKILWKYRIHLIKINGLISVLAVIIILLISNRYTATAVILPDIQNGNFGGIADIASVIGINIGNSDGSMTRLYPSILMSESVLKNIIYNKYYSNEKKDSLNLIDLWDIGGKTPEIRYALALKSLSNKLIVTIDNQTMITTISIEEKDPQLAAAIVNQAVNDLERFIRLQRNTSARAQRIFIEGRLTQVSSDLKDSEEKLKLFREKNKNYNNSEELQLTESRLRRNVSINTELFLQLKKQYEITKIEEVKNTPIINIMDKAEVPALKSYPQRTLSVLIILIISSIISGSYYIYRDFIHRYTSDIVDKFRT